MLVSLKKLICRISYDENIYNRFDICLSTLGKLVKFTENALGFGIGHKHFIGL